MTDEENSPAAVITPALSLAIRTRAGQVVLVVGAGCSVEHPTSLPLARQLSETLHRELVTDGVLRPGDCAEPEDLSAVAAAVKARMASVAELVTRMKEHIRVSPPNEGHYLAAALLIEGSLGSVLTVNFDLALSTALAVLGARNVRVIERPADFPSLGSNNLIYLHRNINEPDPDQMVLLVTDLNEGWRTGWEGPVAGRVLTSPHVIFVGIGTSIGALHVTLQWLREKLPIGCSVLQVDPADWGPTQVSTELGVTQADYRQMGWIDFMRHVAAKASLQQVADFNAQLAACVPRWGGMAVDPTLAEMIVGKDLVHSGRLRAAWTMAGRNYLSAAECDLELLADLALAVWNVKEEFQSDEIRFSDDGTVEFWREGRIAGHAQLATGSGKLTIAEVEARLRARRTNAMSFAIVTGHVGVTPSAVALPIAIERDQRPTGSIVDGPTFQTFSGYDLRDDPEVMSKVPLGSGWLRE